MERICGDLGIETGLSPPLWGKSPGKNSP